MDTWDPQLVLDYFRNRRHSANSYFTLLSRNLLTLLALATGQRQRALWAIAVPNVVQKPSHIEIKIPAPLKTLKVGRPQPTLRLPFFEDHRICPTYTLFCYLKFTEGLRVAEQGLFLTTCAPYPRAAPATLARWICNALRASGVSDEYTAHSTRHASTFAASRRGLSLATLHRTVGWTETSATFAKFYNRELRPDPFAFAQSVLWGYSTRGAPNWFALRPWYTWVSLNFYMYALFGGEVGTISIELHKASSVILFYTNF